MPGKTLNLGILAHVDAGKTTLTERLLHAAGVIDEIGSVDAGTTQTDSLALERQRGITIKSAAAADPGTAARRAANTGDEGRHVDAAGRHPGGSSARVATAAAGADGRRRRRGVRLRPLRTRERHDPDPAAIGLQPTQPRRIPAARRTTGEPSRERAAGDRRVIPRATRAAAVTASAGLAATG